jgi:CheY-like chemotaxis protein
MTRHLAGGRPRGGETILLVEDEDTVRQVGVRILVRLGYRVFEARDAAAALEILGQLSETIHLLLTDVVLPGMQGPELADEVRKRRPGIKTLFASGYAEDDIRQHYSLVHGVSVIQKPFTLEELATRVREALDRP